ncbi:hypothetical protein BDZ91DRAFT_652640 [Kalaharituber pfeilii]|nr:hypothetical protein BDZ91DRAFT_652640 [Kalaharituber pfeilii]
MTAPLSDSYCVRHNVGKPPLPYFPGQQFQVQSHTPPPPTNSQKRGYNQDTSRERQEIHPLERCLLHPPLAGETGSLVLHLKIVEAIRLGDNHSAQLALVHVSNRTSALPNHLVAKFYDPLYFDHQQDDGDPFPCVDHDYSHEASAYVTLRELQGSIIPKYYGSYTLELPVYSGDKQRRRNVRLILMERIRGITMDKLDAKAFSQSERQSLLKAVVDSESAIYNHGIHHRDTYPRNVVIVNPKSPSRVSIIDFGRSCDREIFDQCTAEVPVPPLLRYHAAWGRHSVFGAWIDWDWQSWLEHTYGDTRKAITDRVKEVWEPPVWLRNLSRGSSLDNMHIIEG